MESFENVSHHYVLLFWYIGERNWTVQSTSSIVKPRKEPDEYRPGDIVLAKFQGKTYKSVVIRVEAEKEKLADEKLRFDKLLHDASLTPSQILKEMGIDADLDASGDNSQSKATERPANQPESLLKEKKKKVKPTVTVNSQSKATKRPASQPESLLKEKKKKVKPTVQQDSVLKDVKENNKQKKVATLESSKMMAARILQNSRSLKESQNQVTNHSQPLTENSAFTPTTSQNLVSDPSLPQAGNFTITPLTPQSKVTNASQSPTGNFNITDQTLHTARILQNSRSLESQNQVTNHSQPLTENSAFTSMTSQNLVNDPLLPQAGNFTITQVSQSPTGNSNITDLTLQVTNPPLTGNCNITPMASHNQVTNPLPPVHFQRQYSVLDSTSSISITKFTS